MSIVPSLVVLALTACYVFSIMPPRAANEESSRYIMRYPTRIAWMMGAPLFLLALLGWGLSGSFGQDALTSIGVVVAGFILRTYSDEPILMRK